MHQRRLVRLAAAVQQHPARLKDLGRPIAYTRYEKPISNLATPPGSFFLSGQNCSVTCAYDRGSTALSQNKVQTVLLTLDP